MNLSGLQYSYMEGAHAKNLLPKIIFTASKIEQKNTRYKKRGGYILKTAGNIAKSLKLGSLDAIFPGVLSRKIIVF